MKKSLKVYYVDDDADDLSFLAETATLQGHIVSTFRKGPDLLNALEETEETPDILFLDEYMPQMNGTDILRKIRNHEKLRHIPAVILAGSTLTNHTQNFYDAGANHVLAKPTSMEDYITLLNEAITRVYTESRD